MYVVRCAWKTIHNMSHQYPMMPMTIRQYIVSYLVIISSFDVMMVLSIHQCIDISFVLYIMRWLRKMMPSEYECSWQAFSRMFASSYHWEYVMERWCQSWPMHHRRAWARAVRSIVDTDWCMSLAHGSCIVGVKTRRVLRVWWMKRRWNNYRTYLHAMAHIKKDAFFTFLHHLST